MGAVKAVLIEYTENVALYRKPDGRRTPEKRHAFLEKLERAQRVPLPAEWEDKEFDFSDVCKYFEETGLLVCPSLDVMQQMNDREDELNNFPDPSDTFDR